MTTYPIQFGRYQLLESLAVGGMAELFRAQATGAHGFERTVVIKRILPHLAADPRFTKMFISEAKITARLAHPKIAQTYELGTEGDQLFIAMEYVDGLDAHALLRELAHQQEKLMPGVAVFAMHEVADALDFAHKQTGDDGEPLGIVHRDVSPSNVLLSTRGDVKLVDFGIAQAIQQGHQTKAGTLKGKYGYMSPEQVVGEEVTAKSDIFAAGIVLAEMLMGRRLFAAPNELDVLLMVRDVQLGRLDRFGSDIAPDLMVLVKQCLRKDPFERFLDAAELRDALADWLFNNRKRVGARDVAGLVSRYLDQARFRQTEMMKESTTTTHIIHPEDELLDEAAPTSGVVASPPLEAMAELPLSEEELGVDAGLAESESLVGVEAAVDAAVLADISIPITKPEVLELEPALELEVAVPLEAAPEPEPKAAPEPEPKAAPEPEPKAAASDEHGGMGFLDFGDLDDVDLKSASAREAEKSGVKPLPTSDRAETIAATPLALASEDLAADEGEAGAPAELEMSGESVPIIVGEPVETPFERAKNTSSHPPDPHTEPPHQPDPATEPERGREKRASGNFDSIEAAVASLALPEPDPSTKDFDDREVTEYPAASIKKKIRDKPPEAAVLENAPRVGPPRLRRISVSAAESGDLSETAPLKVLYDKISSSATGLLVIENGAAKKEVYFVDGKPEFVSSNLPSELLGAYLVDEGIISPGELDMALAMLPSYEGKLGDTLVGLGLVRPLDVFRHLARQVRMKLVDACTWQAGTFQWYPERQITREAFPLDIDPYEVLGAGAMGLTPMFLQGWIEDNKNNVPLRTSLELDVERFQIHGLEDIVAKIDGEASVIGHCTSIRDPRDRGRFVRCLFLLLNVGLARF